MQSCVRSHMSNPVQGNRRSNCVNGLVPVLKYRKDIPYMHNAQPNVTMTLCVIEMQQHCFHSFNQSLIHSSATHSTPQSCPQYLTSHHWLPSLYYPFAPPRICGNCDRPFLIRRFLPWRVVTAVVEHRPRQVHSKATMLRRLTLLIIINRCRRSNGSRRIIIVRGSWDSCGSCRELENGVHPTSVSHVYYKHWTYYFGNSLIIIIY